MDFHTFNNFVEEIVNKRDIDTLLEGLIKKLTKIMKAERATFYFYNDEVQELWSYIAKDLEIEAIRVPFGKGIAGKTVELKKILNIKDVATCPFFNSSVDKKTGFKTRNVLSAPIITQEDKLIGLIQVINKRQGDFSHQDESILKGISYYINIALENIRLIQEKETFFRSTLYALTSAIDAKDPVTAGHSHRVAYLAVKIGAAMGFSEDEIRILEYAAYLHDVGKIGVKDYILQKKGTFSKSEYDGMKKHAFFTLQILKNIIFPKGEQKIPEIASAHHEYLDGSGYPLRLKGDEIHQFTRIISVVDIYDAMVSFDRPYKPPSKTKDALKILKREVKNKRLDKKIVNIFINKELYKDERRRYKRLDINMSMSYHIIPQRRIIKDKIKDSNSLTAADLKILKGSNLESHDISAGGVLFLTKLYLPVGTYLDLKMDISTLEFNCIGKVVWIEKVIRIHQYKVGVSFLNLPANLKKAVSNKILSLKTKKQS